MENLTLPGLRLFNMSSDESSSGSRSPSLSPPGRATNRTFVLLRERTTAIPRGKCWDQLNRDGRVKLLEFKSGYSQTRMHELVRRNFPGLAGADFSR